MKTHFTFALLAAAPVALTAGPSLTIYNGDLAVVRDTVPLDLKAGETTVAFDRATAQVMPDSVVLRDPTGKSSFSILEQGYRNDPVSQSLLLSHFEGQLIDFRISYPDGKFEDKPGKIVRSGYVPGGAAQDPIIEMDGKLRFELPGKPLFPELGNDSILRPTLSWTLGSETPMKFDAQLSYLSKGFTWEATYNIVAPEQSNTVSLTGSVTVGNHSGATFRDATLKLIAGDVNRVREEVLTRFSERGGSGNDAMPKSAPVVTEKAFDDFHLYTLGRPVTLRDQETKQVEFKRAPQVKAEKKYVYEASGYNPYDRSSHASPKKIGIYWEFRNDEASGLGIPLPAGKVRFYRADDRDGNLEFVGEDRIQHTPKDEKLTLFTGYAFDLTGERTIVDRVERGRRNWSENSVEIVVRNHSKDPKQIILREHPENGAEWKLTKNSDPFTKVNAGQFEFTVALAPDEEKKVTYTIHESW